MQDLTNKKALILLTNESFMPRSGRGGQTPRRNGQLAISLDTDNGPVIAGSPAAWVSPNPTVLDPPQRYDAIPETMGNFTATHHPTGVDMFELGYIWLTLRKHFKMDLVFATPRGGPVAIDPLSMEHVEKDSKLRDNLREEREFVLKMGHTIPISWVKPEEFSVVILPGGHGALFDLPEHDDIACVVSEIHKRGGLVAAIGHGVAGLLNVRTSRKTGDYLIKGRKVTCFSKEEEHQQGLEKFLPYMLEERIKERGAKLEIAKPFQSHVVVDKHIITAQNAPSIHDFVTEIVDRLRR